MYDQLLQLDPVKINFNKGGMDIINIVLAFVMFGVALGIRPSMFKQVFTKPKAFITGVVSQWVLLPAVTYLLVIILNKHITPMVAMGMILVASCPGGNISNFITSLSNGNRELSVSLTAFSTLFSPISTPANFTIWGGFYVHYLNKHALNALVPLQIPLKDMFVTVFILLGIPLILGMLCTRFLPKVADFLKKPLQYLSIIFFIAMVILSFSQNLGLFLKYIKWIFLIVMMHNALALSTGFAAASIMHTNRRDRRTITIESGIQNSGLGLVLLFNPKIFPPTLMNGGMLFVTAWWGIWHIIAGLTIATIFRLKKLPADEDENYGITSGKGGSSGN
ncbi:MAG: bile acid:sodium symporter family protein [Bacteroidales bacterium]|jgi:BASS family bile acid:Na+ symporter|nr:bile acid:sodium symporter family protein [Bacteroidales bacterium]MCI2145112.1 bile acid:sodium symporter family protein [Bacteroidales bacterium]